MRATETGASTAGRRLVICDDHRVFGESLGILLAAHGYIVVAVTTSPAEALTAVVELGADLCVLDLHFPDGHGLDIVAELRDVSPRCRVLVLSATGALADIERARRLGVAGFVTKSAPIEQVSGALKQIVRGRTAFLVAAPRRPDQDARQVSAARLAKFLTHREREVLQRMVQGNDTREVAATLNISYSTARTHVQNVLTKLGVHSRLEAVALAARGSIFSVEEREVSQRPAS